jgi:uncharacterized repeat protein (TIGR04042 family)
MPEIQFKIEWPDGSQEVCYSPSLIVTEYFVADSDYPLTDFVQRSRTAYTIASDRVRAKYGMPCSRAIAQLQRIEETAMQFQTTPKAKVKVIQFFE